MLLHAVHSKQELFGYSDTIKNYITAIVKFLTKLVIT